ncbi:Iat4p [Lachancea thermotolerans CBS 6340]|uniref:KLTH0H01650p n=1 Tax=Lachancea thermotolerans (strain ATCC 56472 / CBS 6340 / NRRL Y-8284) TaxID=559295 RepID=C5E227_LACTC|nr:KLTH0H01650p [Lachancea thermotolerans CBS 6340]CAR30088.1 KLTH0H01650p [Lachancea thermotolerans CBS 6340]
MMKQSPLSPPASPLVDLESKPVVKVNNGHCRTVVPVNKVTNIERATLTLAKAFHDSKANDYLMKKFANIPSSEEVPKARINEILHQFNLLYAAKGGEIVEANDFDAVAVWTGPGHHFDQDLTNDPVFNHIFFEVLHDKRDEILKELDCYYLFIVGKDLTNPKVRGSVRAIFDTYKRKADEEGVALVLEAINEHARSVYEYFGFKNYHTFHFGAGEVDANGKANPNGEGFVGYLMIYYKDELPGAIDN